MNVVKTKCLGNNLPTKEKIQISHGKCLENCRMPRKFQRLHLKGKLRQKS